MKNNNPCNLRYVGQKGARQGYNNFAYFETKADGMRECLNQIGYDTKRGLTLEQFIHKFAPEFENDTALYIQQVANALGVTPTTKLSRIHPGKLAVAMVKKESSTIIAP